MKLHHLVPCFRWLLHSLVMPNLKWDGNYCYCVFLQKPTYSIQVLDPDSYCKKKSLMSLLLLERLTWEKTRPPATNQPLSFLHAKLFSLLFSLSYATPGKEHSPSRFTQTLRSGFPPYLLLPSLQLLITQFHEVITSTTSAPHYKTFCPSHQKFSLIPCFLQEVREVPKDLSSMLLPPSTDPPRALPSLVPFCFLKGKQAFQHFSFHPSQS